MQLKGRGCTHATGQPCTTCARPSCHLEPSRSNAKVEAETRTHNKDKSFNYRASPLSMHHGALQQTKTGTTVLCEPAQSKCTWTPVTKHVKREFSMNMLQTKTWKNSHCRLCASLQKRNAHGHLAKSYLRENLQQKCWGSDGEP